MLKRSLSAAEFQQAYRVLFNTPGSLAESVGYVQRLDRRTLKQLYRRRAHQTHPDRQTLSAANSDATEAGFRAVVAAYELLRLVQEGGASVAALRPVSRESTTRKTAPQPPSPKASRRTAAPPTAARASTKRTARPQPAASRSADRSSGSGLPPHALQIGQFLYYSDAVSWRQLIDALVWQRQQRPLIGQLALDWGMLSREQISDVLKQRRALGRHDTPFAEFARERGYLSTAQHQLLCHRAERVRQRLGRFFVDRGILDERQLDDYLRAMRLHNWRLQRQAQHYG